MDSSKPLLISLFRYKAWADEGLIAALSPQAAAPRTPHVDTALRLLYHAHVVDRIFAAHLQGTAHGYTHTGFGVELPAPDALFRSVQETDRWYLGYLENVAAQTLAEPIAFAFTDGSGGRMSREEMLAHVATHGGYHRGEAGRLLTQATGSAPRDTFTGYLHEVQPARIDRMGVAGAR